MSAVTPLNTTFSEVSLVSLLIAGGIAKPQESIIRRAYLQYGSTVSAVLAGRGYVQGAVDIYRQAESLPSQETQDRLRLEGISTNGSVCEGSSLTRCFRNRDELVLKPLDKHEHARALELLDALNGKTISGLTPFELHSGTKNQKQFMLMPLFGSSLEVLPHLDNDDIAELWRCLSDALRGLHSLGFAHMDIKLANICLNRCAFVLIDLGSVTRFGAPTTTTRPYVARDYPNGMHYSSARADWWLLAMTLAEKVAGLKVGEFRTPTMAKISEMLEVELPPAIWAELKKELYPAVDEEGHKLRPLEAATLP